MKRILTVMLAITLLAVSAVAFAEDSDQTNQTGTMLARQEQMNAPMQGGQPGQMPFQGRNNGPMQGAQPGQMPSQDQNNAPMQGGQPGGMPPRGQMNGGHRPSGIPGQPGTAPSGNTQSGDAKANDAATDNAQSAQNQPSDMPQLPGSELPANVPDANTQAAEANGNRPANMPGRPGMPGGQAPVMIDFDAMVTRGVISQETCDKIKAYMEEHKPADLPNGQAPEMNGEKPADLPEGQAPETQAPETGTEKPADAANGQAPAMGGLLADLLKDEIITQAEYDALLSAQIS